VQVAVDIDSSAIAVRSGECKGNVCAIAASSMAGFTEDLHLSNNLPLVVHHFTIHARLSTNISILTSVYKYSWLKLCFWWFKPIPATITPTRI